MTRNAYSDENTQPQNPPIVSIDFRYKRKKKQPLDWLAGPYNHARGEMSLWIAVITQAVMDATSHANHPEAIYYKNEAIHWLTGNSKDFIMVCLCAGLDPDYVRRKAKRTLVSPVAWRAEAGKGNRYLERQAYRKRIKHEHKSREVKSDCTGPQVIILRNAFGAHRM